MQRGGQGSFEVIQAGLYDNPMRNVLYTHEGEQEEWKTIRVDYPRYKGGATRVSDHLTMCSYNQTIQPFNWPFQSQSFVKFSQKTFQKHSHHSDHSYVAGQMFRKP